MIQYTIVYRTTISRDFCMRPFFMFIRTILWCFLYGARWQTTFARSTLGAQTTDAGSNSSSAKSMLQPAGYNATRRAVLVTVASVRPLDPSSRRELGPVSYCCCLLGLLCVIDATGTAVCWHSSAVLLLCCPAAIDTGSSSAIVAGSREGNSTYPAGVVVVCL